MKPGRAGGRRTKPAMASSVDDVFSILFNIVDLLTRVFSLVGVVTNLFPDVGTILDFLQRFQPDTTN
ncbi:MAG: hypothetical protein HUU46_03635 [Candidatus Hydrogenedentes bacterium]|nr:hypothetical protein [Candidatus Hydrogenedentota bacterium]